MKKVNEFCYLGRWVNKDHFRTYVYSDTEKKLAGSFKEYDDLINSGIWFDTQELALLGKPKPKPKPRAKPKLVETDLELEVLEDDANS